MIGSDEYRRKVQVATSSRTNGGITDGARIRRHILSSDAQAAKVRVIDIVHPRPTPKHHSAYLGKKPASIRRVIQ